MEDEDGKKMGDGKREERAMGKKSKSKRTSLYTNLSVP